MNRQEPYIGMPILLATFDEDRSRQNQEQRAQQTAPVTTSASASCNTVCSPTEIRQPMALAMAYVPWQRWQETYPLEEGFHRGTIFPELDLPFEGKRKGGMHR